MKHLTLPQRQLIEKMSTQNASRAAIARELGVHPATVKREMERNSVDGVYSAEEAQREAKERKRMHGVRNQIKCTSRYLSFEKLVEWEANFCYSMAARDPDTPVIGHYYKKFRVRRRRTYWYYYQMNRPKRKQQGKRKLKDKAKAWKKWRDRRRMRDYQAESLRRSPRSWYELQRYWYARPKRHHSRLLTDAWCMIRYVNRQLKARQNCEKRIQEREENLAAEKNSSVKKTSLKPVPEYFFMLLSLVAVNLLVAKPVRWKRFKPRP